jgi:hypothetical protein
MAKEELGYIDISGVIDLNEVVIKPQMVMVKVVSEVKSDIIIPEKIRSDMSDNYVIFKLGTAVVGYNLGDIVFDMNMAGAALYRHGEDLYVLIDQYNLKMVTTANNYVKVK